MKFLGEFKLYKDCNQSRSWKIFLRLVEWLGLGHASYSLFQWQAVKMTFFAESRNIKQIRVIWTLHDNAAYVNENTIQLHLILFPHTFLGILPLLLGDSTEVFDAEMPGAGWGSWNWTFHEIAFWNTNFLLQISYTSAELEDQVYVNNKINISNGKI